MKRLSTYIIFFGLLNTVCFSTGSAVPDVVTKVATCATNWLKLETGTRAIGMGGAYTAVGNGISGVPYNPASIAFIDNQEAFLSQTQYVADITYSVLGFGRNMSGTDFIGLHIFALDSGPMDLTTEDEPDGTGEQFKVTGICIRGTYARRLTDRLRIGVTGKYIREDIYTANMQTVALDIGSNFNTGIYGFILGMSVTNLGPEAKYGGEGLEIEQEIEKGDFIYVPSQANHQPVNSSSTENLVLIVARNAPVEIVVELENLGRKDC